MTIGKALVAILLSDAPVTNVVGDKITPLLNVDAKAEAPFLVYVCNDPDPQTILDGTFDSIKQTFTITCFADSYKAAKQLALLVQHALDNKTGTFGGVAVDGIFFEASRETTGSFDDSPDTIYHVVDVDFSSVYAAPA